jgi:hypothetical protein
VEVLKLRSCVTGVARKGERCLARTDDRITIIERDAHTERLVGVLGHADQTERKVGLNGGGHRMARADES